MLTEDHVPSLTHLRDFTRARGKGRATHVAQDRQQVEAPSENRFFAFAYERFLTAVLEYIANGSRGGALHQAVLRVNDRMRRSYEVAAAGMTAVLGTSRSFCTPAAAQHGRRRRRRVRDGQPAAAPGAHHA